MHLPLAAFFLLPTLASFAAADLGIDFGTLQSAGVRGTLTCNGKPSANTKVKLYDVDTLDPDDLMDEDVTDEEGKFELKGKETEVTNIDPKVNIYHDCNDENIPCLLKFSIQIPSTYITQGSSDPAKIFDIGTINLEGSFSGQTRDCFN